MLSLNKRKTQGTKMYTYTYTMQILKILHLMDTCCHYYSDCPDGQRYDEVSARCLGKKNNKKSV